MSPPGWKAYRDFVLKIEPDQEGGYRVEAQGPSGEGKSTFLLPFDEKDLKIFIFEVGQTRKINIRGAIPQPAKPTVDFGRKLFNAVFNGVVRDTYISARTEAERKGYGLRVRLRLVETPELADLPWEYLYDGRDFLALSGNSPLVRYLDLPSLPRPFAVRLPLRILVTVSDPHFYPTLDVEKEKANIENALRGMIQEQKVELIFTSNATLKTLQRTLQKARSEGKPFHIWHFIGHGGFDPVSQTGQLALCDAESLPSMVDGFQLGTLFNTYPETRLVLLNACEGARNSQKDPFAGVAASLVERGIPAVVGMQFEITDTAAITFSEEFYSALVNGLPVDAALTEARRAVFFLPNWVEWATPVLFMRSPDGILFNFQGPAFRKKAETERMAALKIEQERLEKDRAEADRLAKESAEALLLAAQKAKQAQREKEKAEQERLSREKAEAERLAAQKAEQERLMKEKAEAEKVAALIAEHERLEKEKAEAERLAIETANAKMLAAQRAEQEQLKKERAEADRLAKESAEALWLAAQRDEQRRLETEQAEAKKLAAQEAEQAQIEKEKAEQERLAREKAEAERLAAQKAEQERLEKEKAEAERVAALMAEQERLENEKAEQARLAKEKAEAEKLSALKAKQEQLQKEKTKSEGLYVKTITRNYRNAKRILPLAKANFSALSVPLKLSLVTMPLVLFIGFILFANRLIVIPTGIFAPLPEATKTSTPTFAEVTPDKAKALSSPTNNPGHSFISTPTPTITKTLLVTRTPASTASPTITPTKTTSRVSSIQPTVTFTPKPLFFALTLQNRWRNGYVSFRIKGDKIEGEKRFVIEENSQQTVLLPRGAYNLIWWCYQFEKYDYLIGKVVDIQSNKTITLDQNCKMIID